MGLSEIMPVGPAAALALALGLLVAGAFHLDGLADMADAFGGGWTREERLSILGDVLGAITELCTAAVLVLAAALA